MKASRAVKADILAVLEARMGECLRRHAAQLGEPVVAGPDVWLDHWVPRDQLDKFPACLATTTGGATRKLVDIGDGNPRYRWHWPVRIWLWARADGYAQISHEIEALAAAAAEVLLSRPQVSGDVSVSADVKISFSDVASERQTSRSVAGVWVETVAMIDEAAEIDPAGTAEQVDLTVRILDP